MKFNTKTIHGGQKFDPTTGAVMTPIYLSSTYAQKSPGVHQGYEYSRSQNPTREAYEHCVASLEEGDQAFAFASGLAAAATTLDLLKPGDHIVAMDDLYGGTFRLFHDVRKQSAGLDFSFIDMTDIENLKAAIKPATRMVWIESPSNPLLKIVDLAAIGKVIREHNLIGVVDNTFATPWIQQPLKHGFDLVLHSATKYLNGHSDVIGGIVVSSPQRPDLTERMRYLQNALGAIAGAFDSFLILRGLKTLGLRMERHCNSALKIAQWLEAHPKIDKVYYPGLASHPQHQIAKKQMLGFGGIITATLKGTEETAKTFLENCKHFTLAESLGGVESLIEHPAIMTHASVPPEKRQALGITDTLVRISVGIEDVDDLINDLDQALKKA